MKLNVKKYSLIVGIVWGLCIILVGWLAAAGWGNQLIVKSFSTLYIGFKPTFFGSIIGGLWGLLDGLVFCYLVVVLYNKFFSKSRAKVKN